MPTPKTAARLYLEELCEKFPYDSQVIAIRKKLTGVEAIGTTIHEWLHAYFPDAREDVVLQAETELVSLLDSLGMLADEWASDEI